MYFLLVMAISGGGVGDGYSSKSNSSGDDEDADGEGDGDDAAKSKVKRRVVAACCRQTLTDETWDVCTRVVGNATGPYMDIHYRSCSACYSWRS